MSVSLREQIVEILVSNDMCVSIADDKDGVADQILSLFPAPLTEEELEKILPKKRICPSHTPPQYEGCARCDDNWFYNKAIDDCKLALIGKCGGAEVNKELLEVLKEAENIDRLAEEMHDPDTSSARCEELADTINSIKLQIKKALATPTFSGGEKEDYLTHNRGKLEDKD